MAIKPVLKLLITAGICAAAGSTYAGSFLSPYVGADYKLSYTKAKSGWGKMLPTNKLYNNGNLFAGIKVCGCLATELGYTKSSKRTKYSYTSRARIGDVVAPARSAQTMKLSYSSWNIDLNAKFPADQGFSFLGTLGVAIAKPKVNANNKGAASNNSIETIAGKRKMLGRLGLGFQYVKGMIGLRTRIVMENSSRLRINTGDTKYSSKAFNNTYGLTIGAFINL